ncbi:hypothetical protein H6F98_03255 [Microcoleus sp. FACHB-SPT15]|uniref:hypothetical protein n=1 Tax=Microcoleus sp. FACHB-SPT15 TaxID=2692830 RepID=UPI0017811B4E|nr:hypothetical protein [Microcoleus sp. FACHB-SPT15]MBD1804491.1 hypothetical protein [Microcoleus sp. FACHB-SPT15]
MIAKSTRYAVCLGLAGGLAVAIAPAVRAQVQVTGGSAGGQAAFFVPVPGGSGTGVELFDVGINRLRLETSIGNTSTAIFTPTAASFDAGADNQPNTGDTGTLQGTLAGLAFSANGGTPTPFLNRDTALNFTLTSFETNLGVVDGTLISPQTAGDAPLVFLPAVEATVANGSSFQATLGELQLGDFEADINDGVIDLASTLRFRESGSTSTSTTSSVNLQRRIKFTFEGENVTPEDGTDFAVDGNGNGMGDDDDNGMGDDDDNGMGDDDDNGMGDDDDNGMGDDDTGSIRFVGEVNKKLQIQSVGTQGEREFKIEADLAAVDIAIGGPFNIQTDDGLNENNIITKYKIEGEGEGIISDYANAFGFSGTARRDTQFTFEQGTNKLDGRSSGDVDFYAAAGVTSINRDVEFINIQDGDFNSGSSGGSNGSGGSSEFSLCNICGTTLVTNSTVVIGGTDITVGSPIIVVTNSGNAGGSGSSGSSGSSSTSASGSSSNATFANSVNVNVFSLATAFTSSTARTQYQILTSSSIRFVTDIDADFGSDVATGNDDEDRRRTRVRLVQQGGRRYYVVVREGSSGNDDQQTANDTEQDDDDQQTANDTEQDDDDQQTANDTEQDDDDQQTANDTEQDDDDQQTANDTEQDDDDQQTANDTEQDDDDQQTANDTEQDDDDQQTANDTEQDDDDQQTANDTEQDDDDQQTATDTEQDDDDQQTATDTEQDDDDQQTATDTEQDDDDQQTATDTEQDDDETVAAYELVGPSSRCFPGLVGLQQIPDSEVNGIQQ